MTGSVNQQIKTKRGTSGVEQAWMAPAKTATNIGHIPKSSATYTAARVAASPSFGPLHEPNEHLESLRSTSLLPNAAGHRTAVRSGNLDDSNFRVEPTGATK